jgi:hypothetical protein
MAVVPIIGVDCTKGGGIATEYLPLPQGQSREMLLIRASDNWDHGEGFRGTYFDVWGFDPRLTVAVSIQRSHNSNIITPFPHSYISALITARLLVQTAEGIVAGASLPVADLFTNGGALDDATEADGCEITSAVQGIRFVLSAQRTGSTDVDITATVQARPNVALVCRDLAMALLGNVRVTPAVASGW